MEFLGKGGEMNMPATLADVQKIYGDNVYPPYKGQEPFMENDNHIGYKGVVLYNQLEDKVQCSECGEWFKSVGVHACQAHNLPSKDYKDKYGLFRKTPLCIPRLSEKLSTHMTDVNKKIPNLGKRGGDRLKRLTFRQRSSQSLSHNKVQMKNRFGMCDAQIAQRLLIVKNELRLESLNELTMHGIREIDHKLHRNIRSRYKTISNACEKLGLLNTDGKHYIDAEIISKLRNFVRNNKRLPKQNDCRSEEITSWWTIIAHFGSFRRALAMAGLDQLLEEVKNK